jgi:hypothetical protein
MPEGRAAAELARAARFHIFSPLKIVSSSTTSSNGKRRCGLGAAPARSGRFVSMLLSEDMAMKNSEHLIPSRKPFDADLDELLHPARAFAHPQDLVKDPDLTRNEKRAILASWASDACAVEAAPALRAPPGVGVVTVDEVLEALCALDKEDAADPAQGSWSRRQLRRRSLESFRQRRARPNEGADPGAA